MLRVLEESVCRLRTCAVLPADCSMSQVRAVDSPATALRERQFAGVFGAAPFARLEGYTVHPEGSKVAYRHSTALPPELDERWRNVYVDVTSPPEGVASPHLVSDLGTGTGIGLARTRR